MRTETECTSYSKEVRSSSEQSETRIRRGRRQSFGEELVNALTHGIGSLASISAVTVLIVLTAINQDVWDIVSVSIYGGTLFFLLLASTLYHAIPHKTAKRILSLVDHCAIYLLIAGTYTPFLLGSLRSTFGWVVFGIVWGLALIGVVLKLFADRRFHVLHVINYIVMGWIGLLIAPQLMSQISDVAFNLILAGGIVYTVGVLFYAMERIPYCHSVWHLFVLGGCTCHFIAVFIDVTYAVG